ncbi:hypothetical protein CABS03_04692 [Colletotrichum abscissum]|uniref:Uncharacterized protein n=1 Tax=Colletotrichum abscissum TaxID=1671311 RepID=A0A9P9X5F1_9PEZI|nr:hypothetical protein CABS02_12220 [Colletotrichum abscissum]
MSTRRSLWDRCIERTVGKLRFATQGGPSTTRWQTILRLQKQQTIGHELGCSDSALDVWLLDALQLNCCLFCMSDH